MPAGRRCELHVVKGITDRQEAAKDGLPRNGIAVTCTRTGAAASWCRSSSRLRATYGGASDGEANRRRRKTAKTIPPGQGAGRC